MDTPIPPTASPNWHLAQCNIGRLVAPPGDHRIAGFEAELGRINALADLAPGFVWRLKGENNNAMGLAPTPDPCVVLNMSVWKDADSLFEFVYRSAHTPIMARRREWVEPWEGAHQALWWVEAGAIPTIDDAFAKLWLLDRYGPSPRAFTFKARFPSPDVGGGMPVDMQPDPWCVGRA